MSIYIPAQRPAPEEVAAPAPTTPVAVELGWGEVLRTAAARASLVFVGALVLWSLLPLLAGMTPRVILSGSMEPRIHVGDIVVTRTVPAEKIAEGQVVTVTDPDHPEKTRTHRVESRDGDGMLVLKGDANREADSTKVSVDDVLGVGVIRVPYVGRPAYWLAEQNWLALSATTLFLGWCTLNAFPAKRRHEGPTDSDDIDDSDESQDSDDQPRRYRRGPRSRRVAATVAASAIAVGAVAGPAEAAFTRALGNPVSVLTAATSFYPYKTEVLGDSPFLYWKLDETQSSGYSANIADSSSGTSRPGTLLMQSVSMGQDGALAEKPNKAIDFSSGAITANSQSSMGSSFSVEAWIKTTTTQGGRILGFGNGNGQSASSTVDRQLYLGQNGRVYFGIGSAKTTVASTGTIRDGAWHHVVGTYTTGNNGMKLYVDGELQGQTRATTALSSGYWRAAAEGMSGWPSNPGQFLDGTLDELAVYSDVLTAAEVQAHYDKAS